MTQIGSRTKRKFHKGMSSQGMIFKSGEAFNKKKGVCYIPELSDEKYTHKDFLRIADGNEKLAQTLFSIVDWQHPETLMEEWSNDGILDDED